MTNRQDDRSGNGSGTVPARPSERAPGVSRRSALALLSSVAFLGPGERSHAAPSPPARQGTFDYESVVRQARLLGDRPFDPSVSHIPAELTKLTYDTYRQIRFRREKAFWQDGGSDFRLHLFHPGFLHDRPVQIHVVSEGVPIPIPFRTTLFEYGKIPLPQNLPVSLGFAGFAVTTTLNDLNAQDELISFLGASYFRFLGRGHRYGLSARSLALDVGSGQPEEFPFFRSLWLEEPTPNSVNLVIYALLDSPSVSGAFRYVVWPGPQTSVAVTATIVPRKPIPRIGIAPLTSMFLAGEGDRDQRTDFRPEIHDSDGLMLRTGTGEWLWRPIHNPNDVRISGFGDRNPRGFGLMQRDREFGHYQDLEAQYHARPGYWVEPTGDWGEGRVELIELPTHGEGFDNIVCYWTPNALLEPGRATEFNYRITALSTTEALHGLGQVSSSFKGGAPPGSETAAAGFVTRRFIVDFSSGDLAHYLSDPKRVEIVASASVGTIGAKIIDANPSAKGFRAMVDATLRAGETADLRIFLRSGARTLTETWTNTWSAPEGTPAPSATGDAASESRK